MVTECLDLCVLAHHSYLEQGVSDSWLSLVLSHDASKKEDLLHDVL